MFIQQASTHKDQTQERDSILNRYTQKKLSPNLVVQDQRQVNQSTTVQSQTPTSHETIGSHSQLTKRVSNRGVHSNLITSTFFSVGISSPISLVKLFISDTFSDTESNMMVYLCTKAYQSQY